MHVSGPNLDRGEPCSSPRVAEPQAIQSFVETRSSPRVSPSASMRDTSDLRLDVPPEQVDTTLSDVQVITQQLFVRDDWSELQSLRNTQRLMPFARPLRWFRLIGIIAVLIASLFGAFRLLRWF